MYLGDSWWDDGGDGGDLPIDAPPDPWPDPSGPPALPDLPPALPDLPPAPPPPNVDAYTPTLPNLSDIESPSIAPPASSVGDAGDATPSVDDLIGALYRESGGSTRAADGLAMRLRAADPHSDNELLRDAQHALVTQQAIEDYGYPAGAAMALVAVPAYTAAKWIAQTIPGAAAILQPFSADPLTREGGASAASWSEIWWGLRPLWMPLK